MGRMWVEATPKGFRRKKHRGNIVETLILTYIQHILTRRPQKPEFTNF